MDLQEHEVSLDEARDFRASRAARISRDQGQRTEAAP